MRSLIVALAVICLTTPAMAQTSGGALAANPDERQIGDYVAPAWEAPDPPADDAEARGKPLPVPGLGDMVRHKPGAGVWLAEPLEGGHLYLNGKRSRMSLDLKLGF